MKIFHVVQECRAFSLKELKLPKLCSVKPHHRSAYQWLDHVKIYLYAKFEPMSISLKELDRPNDDIKAKPCHCLAH